MIERPSDDAPFIKKLTIEFSNGKVVEVEGAVIKEIKKVRTFTKDPYEDGFYGRNALVGPEELTIRAVIRGRRWMQMKMREKERKQTELEKLPPAPKQLPEHKK